LGISLGIKGEIMPACKYYDGVSDARIEGDMLFWIAYSGDKQIPCRMSLGTLRHFMREAQRLLDIHDTDAEAQIIEMELFRRG
jgi:hypothetical protein